MENTEGYAISQIDVAPSEYVYDISGNLEVCAGSATLLTATGNFSSINWNDSNDAEVSFSTPGEYPVTFTFDNGCTINTSIVIGQQNLITDINGNLSFCEGESTDITVVGDFNSIFWNDILGSSTQTINQAGTYEISVFNDAGCQADTTITIAASTIDYNINGNLNICPGETTNIEVSGNFTSILFNGIPDVTTKSISQAGTYNIQLFNNDGCQVNTDINITELSTPNFSILPAIELTIAEGSSETLELIPDTDVTNYQVSWLPQTVDLSCFDCINPSIIPTQSQTYTATLTNTDTGCTSTQTLNINLQTADVEPPLSPVIPPSPTPIIIQLPSAFSPNNDGVNDQLTVITNLSNSDIANFNWQIYNRWGEQVFTTNSISSSWDGIYRSQVVTTDILVYQLQVQLTNGQIETRKGNIIVLQ